MTVSHTSASSAGASSSRLSSTGLSSPARRRAGAGAGALIGVIAASGAVSGWLVGAAARSVSGNHNAPWVLGRAAGVTSYLLLVALVAMGLVLSHPWRTRLRRPSAATRIRAHISLSVFTLAFIVLHIVVLTTDSYAGVGWRGALLPMGASYRPVAVTLGVVGLYAGLLAGVSAALSGRVTARVWWPIHKVAAVSLALVWAHGLLAGSDTPALRWLYLSTGTAILVLAASRYVARTPADLVGQLSRAGRLHEPGQAAESRRTPR